MKPSKILYQDFVDAIRIRNALRLQHFETEPLRCTGGDHERLGYVFTVHASVELVAPIVTHVVGQKGRRAGFGVDGHDWNQRIYVRAGPTVEQPKASGETVVYVLQPDK